MKKLFFLAALLILNVALTYASDDVLRIWNFDNGNTTDFGGHFNQFANQESSASNYLSDETYRGKGGRSLEITAEKTSGGFCGTWVHFFNVKEKPENRKYLDASDYKYISFRVKGEQGGENFTVQMADASWVQKEDSVPARPLKTYIPEGVTAEWQEVVIPLSDFTGLDTTELGGITFNFTSEGKYKIYIDDIYLKKNKDEPTPETAKQNETFKPKNLRRAMWVWDSYSLLTDSAKRREFFEFCEKYKINDIFLQLQYKTDDSDPENIVTEVTMIDEFRGFIAESHDNGLFIQALEGYPDWVIKPMHKYSLSMIKSVIDYNKKVSPEERFDGIHLDNEPYLLVGFINPEYRKQILSEFIELNDKASRMVHENSDMVYGIDIPYWFEEKDEEFNAAGSCEYNGTEKPASCHIIDLVDNIGIMDYRDFAYGADGMIAHAVDEIKYADQKGKKVYIGIETFRYPLITVKMVCGFEKEEFMARLNKELKELRDISRMCGASFRLQVLSTGNYIHAGLEVPQGMDKEKQKHFDEALLKLARWIGRDVSDTDIDDLVFDAEYAISKNPEWDGLAEIEISSPDGKEKYPGFETTLIMLPKITFDDKTKAEMERELTAVEKHFSENESFFGFAIHYYATYKNMPDK
ncbi:CIA30 family protein [bacterium]|jgi:hypothetical protein|nr:CIA30 family protein [bacterium]